MANADTATGASSRQQREPVIGVLYEIQDTALTERVDELIDSHKSERPLLHSTTMHATIAELIRRNEGLEEAIRELARGLQDLATA